jgi:hypothetical protein
MESSDEETTRATSASDSRPSPKRPRDETDDEDVSSLSSASALSESEYESDADMLAVTRDLAVRDGRQLYRLRRRGGALRRPRFGTGRARADDFVATVRLMSEVEALRRQRDELMSLHHTRVLNTRSRDALVNTIIEYYDTFRDGFRGPRLPDMLRFFNTRLDGENFAYGGGSLGLDTWIEQWRRYTHLFPSTSMRLQSMNVIDLVDQSARHQVSSLLENDPTIAVCLIETTGVLDGLITRQAVCTMCPHLRGREDLIRKLVGRSLALPINLRFYFNNAGRMIRYDFDGDYFQAFSNLEDVGLLELTQIMEHVAIGENTTMPAPVELGDDDDGGRLETSTQYHQ